METIRSTYRLHIAVMLKLAGIADADAKAARIFDLESRIAAAHWNRTESEDVLKANNPWARDDFARRAPGMDWPTFFLAAGLNDAPRVIVWQPSAIAGISALIGQLPGVQACSMGNVVPWRDAGQFGGGSPFKVEGYTPADGEEDPMGRVRIVGPRFFTTLGISVLAGREFNDDEPEPVAIVSQSVAQRLFPNGEALNRHVWADFMMATSAARRIVGVVTDVDDENVVQQPGMTIYVPVSPMIGYGGRLFVRTAADPYSIVPAVTRVVRALAPDQPVERAATLEDVRATVLTPERVNAFVFSGFAGIALLIAVVGVASVLAFSVSARTREFGVRLAVGSAPSQLVLRVVSEGLAIAAIGIAAGAAGGYTLARVAARFVANMQMPGALPAAGAAAVLIGAAVVASLMPAARASSVDVLQALRSE